MKNGLALKQFGGVGLLCAVLFCFVVNCFGSSGSIDSTREHMASTRYDQEKKATAIVGRIVGTVCSCLNSEPLEAKLYLYKMKDTIVDSLRQSIRGQKIDERSTLTISSQTDSLGGFSFISLPLGYYELDVQNKRSAFEDPCIRTIVSYIRVAPDSTAIVSTRATYNVGIVSSTVSHWVPNFYSGLGDK